MEFLSTFDTSGLSPQALEAFRALEQAYGQGFNVTSAYRSPEHNAAVGGAKHSEHMNGNAFDISVAGLSQAEQIALIGLARQAGFGGVGVYNGSLHFDVGPTRHWGADYPGASTPEWAAGAVGAERGQAAPQNAPANALAGGEDKQQALANKLALFERFRPQMNPLDPNAFRSQPLNALAIDYNFG